MYLGELPGVLAGVERVGGQRGGGLHAPRRQRFSLHVAALKTSHRVSGLPYMSRAQRLNQSGRFLYCMSGGLTASEGWGRAEARVGGGVI